MKVKEESEKGGLNLNIEKTKIMASGLITSWQVDGETVETVIGFVFFLCFKITPVFSSAMWHWWGEIFDLAIESLIKVRILRKHRGWLQRSKHLNEKLI